MTVTEQAGEFRSVLELSDRCEARAWRPRPGGAVAVLPASLLGWPRFHLRLARCGTLFQVPRVRAAMSGRSPCAGDFSRRATQCYFKGKLVAGSPVQL